MDRRKDVVLKADIEEVGGVGHLALHFVIDDALEEEGGGGVGEVLGTDTPTFLLEVGFLEKRTQGGIEIDGAQVLVVNGIRGGEGVGGVVAGGEGIHVVPAGGGISGGEFLETYNISIWDIRETSIQHFEERVSHRVPITNNQRHPHGIAS